MIKTISSKTVYKNKWMEVFEDEVEFENGVPFIAKTNLSAPLENPSEQHDEMIEEKKFFSLDHSLKMIDNGEITDAYSANAIQMVARRFRKEL